jgi:hypothetical protein
MSQSDSSSPIKELLNDTAQDPHYIYGAAVLVDAGLKIHGHAQQGIPEYRQKINTDIKAKNALLIAGIVIGALSITMEARSIYQSKNRKEALKQSAPKLLQASLALASGILSISAASGLATPLMIASGSSKVAESFYQTSKSIYKLKQAKGKKETNKCSRELVKNAEKLLLHCLTLVLTISILTPLIPVGLIL